MPFLLERVDHVFTNSKAWSNLDPVLTDLPSTQVPGRVFGCFFDDMVGVDARHQIGIEQLVFETDYPHQDSTWPDTPKLVAEIGERVTPPGARDAHADERHRHVGPRSGRPSPAGGGLMAYDVVIRNGLVVDGSGLGSFRGDVGIIDGRIATHRAHQGARRDRYRRRGSRRHPRLYRRPHPFRCAGVLGPARDQFVLARGHHGGHGPLWLHLGAGGARGAHARRPQPRARRGHLRCGHGGRDRLELDDLRRSTSMPSTANPRA